MMVLVFKRQFIDLIFIDEVLECFLNDEDLVEGMESGEESDLDWQFENEIGELR